MSKVYTLVDKIRDTLNDPEGDRWTNARILRSINEATKTINLRANILRGKGSFKVLAGISKYKLPDNVQVVTRVLYNGKPLKFKSHSQMDELIESWETDYGNNLEYIVYDKLNIAYIRLYPIPQVPSTNLDTFGTITDLGNAELNSIFGVLTNVYYDISDITIYYIYKPEEVISLSDELPLNDIWDTAIKHYVCGFLLRDDKDTQNRAFGNEELQLFNSELQQAFKLSSLDYSENTKYETAYRSI